MRHFRYQSKTLILSRTSHLNTNKQSYKHIHNLLDCYEPTPLMKKEETCSRRLSSVPVGKKMREDSPLRPRRRYEI